MLKRIEKSLDSLSPAEAQVGRWVIAHPRQAAEATLASVAEACGTSQPTVIRFCRRMGLGGFRELALRLTEALSQRSNFVHRDVNADDSIRDASGKVMESAIQTLIEQRLLLRDIDVERVAALLAASRQIAFIGLGGSGHVAADACHKFFRLGMPCVTLADPSSIRQFAAIAGRDDTLLMISNSGQWPELCAGAQRARERGATVIAITDPASSLAASAGIVLPCSSQDETSLFTPMNSRLAQLAVLDVLQVATALTAGEPAAENLKQTKLALGSDLTPRSGALQ